MDKKKLDLRDFRTCHPDKQIPAILPERGTRRRALWAPHKWLIAVLVLVAVFVAGVFVPSPLVKKMVKGFGYSFLDSDAVAVKDTTGMRLPDGSVYEGYINAETKAFHGFGVLRRGDSSFEGEWQDGLLPFGVRNSPDGVYEGNFDENLNRDGYGVMTYSDRYIKGNRRRGTPDSRILSSYAGHWAANRMEGLGRVVMADNTMDFGEFADGRLRKASAPGYNVGDKVYGIDVSHHNGEIRWDELALYCDENGKVFEGKVPRQSWMQPVSFAYVKATEGSNFKDSDYERNSVAAQRHGIAKGAYHFLRLGSPLDEQVDNFLETVSWSPGDLPPALDVELEDEIKTHGKKALLDKTFGWLEAVEKEMGVRPIIYTREGIRDKYLSQDPRFSKYECWIARYNSKGPESDDWRMWQFSENGDVSGHDGKMDINLFNDDYDAFCRYLATRSTGSSASSSRLTARK